LLNGHVASALLHASHVAACHHVWVHHLGHWLLTHHLLWEARLLSLHLLGRKWLSWYGLWLLLILHF
jgi:hypothetical protein